MQTNNTTIMKNSKIVTPQLVKNYKQHTAISMDALHFNSLHEFFESAKQVQELASDRTTEEHKLLASRSSSRVHNIMDKNNTDDWTFGRDKCLANFEEKRYQPEQRIVDECRNKVASLMSEKEFKDVMKAAVAFKRRMVSTQMGGPLDTARYLQGAESYHRKLHSKKAQVRAMKIAIGTTISGGSEEQALLDVFINTVPSIIAIEAAGIPVELYCANFVTSGLRTDGAFAKSGIYTKIKTSERKLNMNDVAIFGRIAAFRHYAFILMESQFGQKIHRGLGQVKGLTDAEAEVLGFNIYAGYGSQDSHTGSLDGMKAFHSKLMKLSGITNK